MVILRVAHFIRATVLTLSASLLVAVQSQADTFRQSGMNCLADGLVSTGVNDQDPCFDVRLTCHTHLKSGQIDFTPEQALENLLRRIERHGDPSEQIQWCAIPTLAYNEHILCEHFCETLNPATPCFYLGCQEESSSPGEPMTWSRMLVGEPQYLGGVMEVDAVTLPGMPPVRIRYDNSSIYFPRMVVHEGVISYQAEILCDCTGNLFQDFEGQLDHPTTGSDRTREPREPR